MWYTGDVKSSTIKGRRSWLGKSSDAVCVAMVDGGYGISAVSEKKFTLRYIIGDR